jgi:hypothetical protein
MISLVNPTINRNFARNEQHPFYVQIWDQMHTVQYSVPVVTKNIF